MKFHLLNSLNPFLIALTANLNLNDTQNNIKSYFKILNSCLVIVFTYAHQSSSVVNRTARTFRTELICCPPWYEIFFHFIKSVSRNISHNKYFEHITVPIYNLSCLNKNKLGI
uniref:Uncharacterized protein n=1 Tax=Cacopsylla melanoneura TaxID=428564 RepID=A0A8D8SMI2_9HEMI